MSPLEYSSMTPTEIAALNTRDALNYFWSLPNEDYFSPERMRLFEIVAERVKEIWPKPSTIYAIDVGCGPGQMFMTLLRNMPEYDLMLTGIDWATSAIERAKVNLSEAKFEVFDLFALPFGHDSHFDLVLCIEVLEHQDDWRGAMERLHWRAKPGGHIIITVPNGATDDWVGHRQFWTLEDLRRDFAQYGLVSAELIKDGTNILADLMRVEHADRAI